MKRKCMTCLATVLSVWIGQVAASEVYRVVDADGNVSYTDMAPGTDAEPLDLKPISAIKTPDRPEPESREPLVEELPAVPDQAEQPNLRRLRRLFSDFRIIYPVPNQTFRGETSPATMAWETSEPLREGMKVAFYINGQRRAITREQVVSTGRLDRGQHRVRAELLSPTNRVVAESEEIPFNIHRENRWITLPGTRIR